MTGNHPAEDTSASDSSGIFKDHGLAKVTRQMVKVDAHLDNGKTRVSALKFHNGSSAIDAPLQEWDIPTGSIPGHLRALGSQFVLSLPVNKKNTPR
jgi:hypothetical protein